MIINSNLKSDSLMLSNDLFGFKYLKFSIYPEIPGNDENEKYEILDHEFLETHTGLLLILNLRKLSTNEELRHIYADITSIEYNSNSNPKFAKYYLMCTNRLRKMEIDKAKQYQKNGIPLDEDQVEALEQGETDTFRILLLNE